MSGDAIGPNERVLLVEEGVKVERASVVRWLRMVTDIGILDVTGADVRSVVGVLASGIERADHTKSKNTEETGGAPDLTPGLGPPVSFSAASEGLSLTPLQESPVRTAKRCYDLYLWAFAKARSGGVVDVEFSEDHEREVGADVVLLHRRAILQGVIDGKDVNDDPTVVGPMRLWESIRIGTFDEIASCP